jgi:hypothetical protein
MLRAHYHHVSPMMPSTALLGLSLLLAGGAAAVPSDLFEFERRVLQTKDCKAVPLRECGTKIGVDTCLRCAPGGGYDCEVCCPGLKRTSIGGYSFCEPGKGPPPPPPGPGGTYLCYKDQCYAGKGTQSKAQCDASCGAPSPPPGPGAGYLCYQGVCYSGKGGTQSKAQCDASCGGPPGPPPGGDSWDTYTVAGMEVQSVTGGSDRSAYEKVVIMLHGGGETGAMWPNYYSMGWFGTQGSGLNGLKYVFPTSPDHLWYHLPRSTATGMLNWRLRFTHAVESWCADLYQNAAGQVPGLQEPGVRPAQRLRLQHLLHSIQGLACAGPDRSRDGVAGHQEQREEGLPGGLQRGRPDGIHLTYSHPPQRAVDSIVGSAPDRAFADPPSAHTAYIYYIDGVHAAGEPSLRARGRERLRWLPPPAAREHAGRADGGRSGQRLLLRPGHALDDLARIRGPDLPRGAAEFDSQCCINSCSARKGRCGKLMIDCEFLSRRVWWYVRDSDGRASRRMHRPSRSTPGRVSQNGCLMSRRGRSLPANASGLDTHRDSITSRFDCRYLRGARMQLHHDHPRDPRHDTHPAAAGVHAVHCIRAQWHRQLVTWWKLSQLMIL